MSSSNSRYHYEIPPYPDGRYPIPQPLAVPQSDLMDTDAFNNRERTNPEMSYNGAGQHMQFHQEGSEYMFKPAGRRFIPPHDQGYMDGGMPGPQSFGQMNAFTANPIMTDVAMMYGNRLMDTGKEMVDKKLNKYISSFRLRYYFAVDTAYTLKKLKLLMFPYNHESWVPKRINEVIACPKDDVNAPDLYIPLMAYVTYLLLAGVVIGTQNMFKPEILGLLASRALVCVLIELIIQLITIYIINLHTRLTTWDLLAFSGYKFVGIIVAILLKRAVGNLGYYIGIIYCGISLAFFFMRALKWHMIESTSECSPDFRGNMSVVEQYQKKRRLYFLFLIALSQPILMWWLSYSIDYSPSPQ